MIPETFGRYHLTVDGIVIDIFQAKPIHPVDMVYRLPVDWMKNGISVAKLIAVVYKGWHAPLEYVHRCEILYSDNNPDNLNPLNLIWKFPKGGLEVPTMPGYYFIPGHTRYAINKEYQVIHLPTGRIKTTNIAKNGYGNLGMTLDNNKYSGSNPHRVIALTFLEYDNNVNRMVVNHIDNDRSNNDLSNLEWVTYGENLIHGRIIHNGYKGSAKGLRSGFVKGIDNNNDNKGYEVKNIRTGEVKKYLSWYSAARGIGVSTSKLAKRLNGETLSPIVGGFYIVRKCGEDWPEIPEEVSPRGIGKLTTIVENEVTGEIKEYPSAKHAYLSMGASRKVVTTRLRNGDKRPYNGYIYYYKGM